MSRQLPLRITLPDASTFQAFEAAGNEAAVARVRDLADGHERALFLWGPAGAGKTHLLQAACRAASNAGRPAAYLPLAAPDQLTPDGLQGLEAMAVLALDDVTAVAGDPSWEQALFRLLDQAWASGGVVLAAARASPAHLGIGRDDLRTRLAWGPVYHIRGLNDDGKLEALRRRARQRGLTLPDAVGRYLLRHYPRDPHALFALLDELDCASLSAQRRLTLPFVREVLAKSRGGHGA